MTRADNHKPEIEKMATFEGYKVRQAVGKTKTSNESKDVLIVQYHEAVEDLWEFEGVLYKVDDENFGKAFRNRDLGGKVCYAYITEVIGQVSSLTEYKS